MQKFLSCYSSTKTVRSCQLHQHTQKTVTAFEMQNKCLEVVLVWRERISNS